MIEMKRGEQNLPVLQEWKQRNQKDDSVYAALEKQRKKSSGFRIELHTTSLTSVFASSSPSWVSVTGSMCAM